MNKYPRPKVNRPIKRQIMRKKQPVIPETVTATVYPQILEMLTLYTPIEKIDLQSLYNILSAQRKPYGNAEREIIGRYISNQCVKDTYGNYHIHIFKKDNSASEVMWSCHTDTVHRSDGHQKLHLTTHGILKVDDREKNKECLGADDGAGLWLMLEMIKAGVPGWYIFHREEETGRKGSQWAAKNLPKEAFADINYSIAFDRLNNSSVITYQRGSRCCSDEFAESIISIMGDMKYRKDTGGSYTDTASYTELISECTNLSVGYTGAHGGSETLDLVHLLKMWNVLTKFDESKLIHKRDQTKPAESLYNNYHNNNYTGYGAGMSYNAGFSEWMQREHQGSTIKMVSHATWYSGIDKNKMELAQMSRIIMAWTWEIATLLQSYGHDPDGLFEAIYEQEMNARMAETLGVDVKDMIEDEGMRNVIHIGTPKDKSQSNRAARLDNTYASNISDAKNSTSLTSTEDALRRWGGINDDDVDEEGFVRPVQGPSNRPKVDADGHIIKPVTVTDLIEASRATNTTGTAMMHFNVDGTPVIDKAKSHNEILADQIKAEAVRLSEVARNKANNVHVSTTGVYSEDELELLK